MAKPKKKVAPKIAPIAPKWDTVLQRKTLTGK
jgi:hypothetical protein